MIKPKKTLENIKPYSIDRFYTDYKLKLDSNENPYGPSPVVIQALREFSLDKIKFYPAYGELIDKLAAFINVKSENLILTNGCDEAINVCLNTYLEKGNKVLSFAPTFSMPKLYCECIGADFLEISYDNDFKFDYDKFSASIKDDIKILYITSPNNPTGEVVSVETIRKLLKNYPDKLLILDCTYFNYANVVQSEYFSLIGEFDNLIIVKSFSKDYALAGLRLGYICAGVSIVNEVKKVISPYSVNAVAVQAGAAALSDIEYFKFIRKKLLESKDNLALALNRLGYKVTKTEANFILCDFGDYADFIYQKLLNNGVKVKYFKNIKGLENTFRITVPRLEDVDFLISLFNQKPLFVFDMDGVLFDVQDSYREAIKQTYKYYLGHLPSDNEIQNVKNMGNMCNDWDVTHYLIKKAGKNADYNQMVDVFQNLFFVKDKKPCPGLIDNEINVFDKTFFKKLTKYADCAIFTMRPKDEAFYSLEKYDIKKYFSYIICNEDVEGKYKPDPFGLLKIMKHSPHTEVYYFGDTVDDVLAGVNAKTLSYGVIPPRAECVDETKNAMLKCGAKDVIIKPEDILKLIEEDNLCI